MSEVVNTLILIDIIHGHSISRKKIRHIRHLLATVQPRIFGPYFFTIKDVLLLEKQNYETKTKFLIGRYGIDCCNKTAAVFVRNHPRRAMSELC